MEVCSTRGVSGHWLPTSLRAPTVPSLSSPQPHPSLSCWLTVKQTSWPDAGRGVPTSCLSHHPSQAATDAASRKQPPSKSRPGKWDPSRPRHPFRGWGLFSARCLGPQEGVGGGGVAGRVRGELSQVPGEPATADVTQATTHGSLSPGALWSCLALPRVLPPSSGAMATSLQGPHSPLLSLTPSLGPLGKSRGSVSLTLVTCQMGCWEDRRSCGKEFPGSPGMQ